MDIEGEGVSFGLACCEVLNVAGCNGVVPGDHASETGACGVGENVGGECAEGTSTRCDGADGVDVS